MQEKTALSGKELSTARENEYHLESVSKLNLRVESSSFALLSLYLSKLPAREQQIVL